MQEWGSYTNRPYGVYLKPFCSIAAISGSLVIQRRSSRGRRWRRFWGSSLRSVQLGVFGLGFFKDRDVGVGVFPLGEEILIGGAGFGVVPLQDVGASQIQASERIERGRWRSTP